MKKLEEYKFINFGFTLIELLAVIVILAIIALIAIPLIGNVIEKAKIGALENSVNGLVESANMYYANQSIKGEQATETIFDFANGEQTSTSKLEYKGKVYNGKLILHANGEVAVCIDDKEHYAYKNKDTDEIVSGIGTCVYDGTTGDFSSNSSIKDLRGKTVVATNITQSADGLSTLITIPEEGHYDTNSIISVLNNNLGGKIIVGSFMAINGTKNIDIGFKPNLVIFSLDTSKPAALFKSSSNAHSGVSYIKENTFYNHNVFGTSKDITSFVDNGFTFVYDNSRYVSYIAFENASEEMIDIIHSANFS